MLRLLFCKTKPHLLLDLPAHPLRRLDHPLCRFCSSIFSRGDDPHLLHRRAGHHRHLDHGLLLPMLLPEKTRRAGPEADGPQRPVRAAAAARGTADRPLRAADAAAVRAAALPARVACRRGPAPAVPAAAAAAAHREDAAARPAAAAAVRGRRGDGGGGRPGGRQRHRDGARGRVARQERVGRRRARRRAAGRAPGAQGPGRDFALHAPHGSAAAAAGGPGARLRLAGAGDGRRRGRRRLGQERRPDG
mmetsp:Transcript_1676/g.4765  ORF Transcript_1676/g.4765 Transcript_1676/m.4765 type:complete len:248 (+) Transcript_1676:215-958(+)